MAHEIRPLGWEESLAAGAGVVGGKGWQLARLASYGLPVPPGLAIPAIWSDRRHGDFPEELAAELRRALGDRGWLDQPLAVRSSAVGEDSAGASFAGIYHSHLNVVGWAAIAEAIQDVWRSLDTPQAAAYRQRQGLPDDGAAMAVLLMPLLPARASGIAFTCDPLSGRDDRLVIHAHWGLGESLVGGLAEGDEYLFEERLREIVLTPVSKRLGSKAAAFCPRPGGGTVAHDTAPAEQQRFVLEDAAALALAELLRDAALALDFVHPAFDLEWVWDGERFWLTQARPVTARPRNTYPGLRGQPAYWSRGNTCEVVPEPLSAADWNCSRRLVNVLLEEGYALAGYPLLPGAQRGGLFHGRLYLNLSLIQWEGYDALGVTPQAMNALVGGHQPEIAVPPPTFAQRLQRLRRMLRYLMRSPKRRRQGLRTIAEAFQKTSAWRRQTLPEDAGELAAAFAEQMRAVVDAKDIHFLQGSGGGSVALLIDQLEKRFPGEGHALGAALLAGGEPSVTVQQGYDLMALARLGMADAQVRPHLEATSTDASWLAGLPADNPFRLTFASFLERYGHRGLYETYLRNPRWREEPAYLLQSLVPLAAVDENALRARQRAGAESAWARIRTQVPAWLRPFFAALARGAKRDCDQREAARSALIAHIEPMRRVLLAAGARLVAQNMLDSAEEVFHLMPSELVRVLHGLIPAAGVRGRVADRRQQFEEWCATAAPDVLTETDRQPARSWSDADPQPAVGRRRQGIPTGTGRARGRARILHHPSEGGRLQAGEILVAPSTDPGWTPLFLKAGGLAVETGGYLSHGAIVAREFGIPAVVNLPSLLEQVRDGDLLDVDGVSGIVTLMDGEDAASE